MPKCAICNASLENEHWVYSAWTGNRYCMPGEGCFTVGAEKRESAVALKAAVEKVPVEQAERAGTSVGGGFNYKPNSVKSAKPAAPVREEARPSTEGTDGSEVLQDLSQPFLSTR